MSEKRVCGGCGWRGLDTEVLAAPNPFAPSETIHGCPKCSALDTMWLACDELECWRPVTCGTPIKDGYRRTCGKHAPRWVPDIGPGVLP